MEVIPFGSEWSAHPNSQASLSVAGAFASAGAVEGTSMARWTAVVSYYNAMGI